MGYVPRLCVCFFFFFKQKTAYEMRISDWSSDVCSSDLMLLTHVDSRVPVAMVRDGTPALVFGRNDALLEVKTVITDRNPFRPGDLLITSGAGGIYPPDVAVAVVVKPTAEGALARPAVAPEELGFVIVEEPFVPRVTPPRKAHRKSTP